LSAFSIDRKTQNTTEGALKTKRLMRAILANVNVLVKLVELKGILPIMFHRIVTKTFVRNPA
jgi:hypothetical protein